MVYVDGEPVVVDDRMPLGDLMEPGTKEDDPRDLSALAQSVGELMARVKYEHPDVLEERFEEICKGLQQMVDRERVRTLKALLNYLWSGARSPWCVMKNVLAVTRRVKPLLIKGVSQTEVAWLLDETRAAVHAREKRTVEELLQRWGVKGFKLFGGTKSEAAREKYRDVQKGNCNRRGGKKLKKDQ